MQNKWFLPRVIQQYHQNTIYIRKACPVYAVYLSTNKYISYTNKIHVIWEQKSYQYCQTQYIALALVYDGPQTIPPKVGTTFTSIWGSQEQDKIVHLSL
jgi:hypothetical protein